MCNAKQEKGTSKAASREITEKTSKEISRGVPKATTWAAGRVATKGSRALVATGKDIRTQSNRVVMVVVAIKGNATISCSQLCVLTVGRMATWQGFVGNWAGMGRLFVIQIKFRTQKAPKGTAHKPSGRATHRTSRSQRCPMLPQSKS